MGEMDDVMSLEVRLTPVNGFGLLGVVATNIGGIWVICVVLLLAQAFRVVESVSGVASTLGMILGVF